MCGLCQQMVNRALQYAANIAAGVFGCDTVAASRLANSMELAQKLNVKRGLIRLWVLFTIGWLAVAGGVTVIIWSDVLLAQLGRIIGAAAPAGVDPVVSPKPSPSDASAKPNAGGWAPAPGAQPLP